MTDARPPLWFRFHSAELILRTEGLSAIAGSIILQLFPRMHQNGEPIRRDHAALSRLCGTTKPAFERALVELKDRGLIIEKDGGIWSEIIEDEIDHHAEKSAQSTKSVSKRWEKTKQNQRPADTNVSPERDTDVEGYPPTADNLIGRRSTTKREASRARAREALRPGDPVEIKGFGLCSVERVFADRIIVRSNDYGNTLRVALDANGNTVPASATEIDDDERNEEYERAV